MKLLDGKAVADEIKNEIKRQVGEIKEKGKEVCLAVIQVGNDSASNVYIKNKEKACEYVGIRTQTYKLDEDANSWDIIRLIRYLNEDFYVNGILVQLPLPSRFRGAEVRQILDNIDPLKDVDGFHRLNVGGVALGKREDFIPCTTLGILSLLKYYDIEIAGQNCVVVGRSDIVGKPTALELLHHDGTVTICHSKTKNLKEICQTADILVCAIGKPKFFTKEYVKDGAIVIDVGIHRQEDGSLCGDVDFDDVKDIVSAITPVPKGVGAMTVAMLLHNCVQAFKAQDFETRCHRKGGVIE